MGETKKKIKLLNTVAAFHGISANATEEIEIDARWADELIVSGKAVELEPKKAAKVSKKEEVT